MTTSPAPTSPAPTSPRAPESRPTWLLTLAMLNLILGAMGLFGGIGTLRDPAFSTRGGETTSGLSWDEREALDRMQQASRQVALDHAGVLRTRAALQVVTALCLLYGAATAFTRDPGGRKANLVAGWVAIGNQLGGLVLTLPLAGAHAEASRPVLEALYRDRAGGAMPAPVGVLFVAVPVVTALLAIGYASVLLVYFGGRRGRELYGIGKAPGAV